MSSKSFLGTLNTLTAGSAARQREQNATPERVQRSVLERLREGPATESDLYDLSIPVSQLSSALETLIRLKMVEVKDQDGQKRFSLTDYAQKALIYLSPA